MSTRVTRLPFGRRYLAGWALTTAGTGLVFPLTAVYLREQMGLSVFGVSLYFMLFAVAGLVVNPVAGALCDRVGPGRIAVLATACQAVGPFFLVARQPADLNLLAALLSGAGTGIFYAVQTPMLLSVFGADNLGRVLAAKYRVSAGAVGAGSIAGGALASSLGTTGYQLSFAVNGLTYLGYGLVLIGIARARRRDRVGTPGETTGASLAEVVAPFTDRVFLWVLLLQGMLVVFGLGQVESVLPIVLRDSAQLTVSGISVVLAVNSISVIALQGLVVRAVERIGYIPALRAAIICWCASLVLLAGAGVVSAGWARLLLAAGYSLVFAIGQCLIAPSLQPVVVANAPPHRVAVYSSSTSLVYGMGNLAAPALCLPLFTALGFGGYLGLQLAGYVVGGVAIAVIAAGQRRDNRQSETNAAGQRSARGVV
ncbi:MFS transporter [Saccharothrix coeruleofusca]|uniref:Major facilitator superfamily (MFS) profile domain-containing protein n=1 Tax=Saccharothrix coeruleofusca TaxID=33919 RepID=A0A918EH24_9PSEU|nr:MFS transporter [Saccharothrix coeruleofusca]MBP2336006.1 putative MFS family arabinose efflux permease [Saccharothrix coeruleofusca]GGP76049.1 hypothetical protein GCM10010185_57100 [Saccharothrix coeruleofusca]